MKLQHAWLNRLALLILLLLGSAGAQAFPEIPFCPLGGPPGWLNRLTDDDDHHRYYPPPYYPPPVAVPYWYQGAPYSYVPQHYPYLALPGR